MGATASIEKLDGVFETVLARLETGSEEDRVIPQEVMDNLRDIDLAVTVDSSPSSPRFKYKNTVATIRCVLSKVAMQSVGDISNREQRVLRDVARFVNGPLLEVAVAIEDDRESLDRGGCNAVQMEGKWLAKQLEAADMVAKSCQNPPLDNKV